jgi:hypothetical protein
MRDIRKHGWLWILLLWGCGPGEAPPPEYAPIEGRPVQRAGPPPAVAAARPPADRARVEQAAGYRGARWGSSLEEVRMRFPSAGVALGGKLTMDGEVAGRRAQTVLLFGDDRLDRVVVSFKEQHGDPQLYIQDFFALRDLLTKKHGKPTREISRGRQGETTLRSSPSSWGQKVARGELTLLTVWTRPHTEIVLACGGHEGRPHLSIEYTAVGLAGQTTREQRKQLDGL